MVKRYMPIGRMQVIEHIAGPYIRHEDYAALGASIHEHAVTGDHNLIPHYEAQIERLERVLSASGEELHALWLHDRGEMIKAIEKQSALETENARLREQLNDAQAQIRAYSGHISTDGR